MTSDPVVAFKGLNVTFKDGTVALANVSFAVPQGKFVVVLGPSGSGKSTLLRAVLGLVKPSHGSIEIDGRTVTPETLSIIRRKVGMIHQDFRLVERASVATNVMAGAAAGMATWRVLTGVYPLADKTKVCRLMDAVGLSPTHLERQVRNLSGGQQQRVGIARAFMTDPVVVLADEPVASLDPKFSFDVLGLLKAQARIHGATVLCSLHQTDLARRFADRIICLKDGAVFFDGCPDALSSDVIASLYGRQRDVVVDMEAGQGLDQVVFQ